VGREKGFRKEGVRVRERSVVITRRNNAGLHERGNSKEALFEDVRKERNNREEEDIQRGENNTSCGRKYPKGRRNRGRSKSGAK